MDQCTVGAGVARSMTVAFKPEPRGTPGHEHGRIFSGPRCAHASVERALIRPSGEAGRVGGGVVLAASYEAKAFGVHGGMPSG